MKIDLQDLKKPSIDTAIERQIEHGDLRLTLQVKDDTAFKSAFAKVAPLLDDKTVHKDDLKRSAQTDISSQEMLLYVIGEYCVGDWNVSDKDDTPIAVNGDNFLLVLGALPNLSEFLLQLIETFGDMMTQFANTVDDIKKKPKTTTKS